MSAKDAPKVTSAFAIDNRTASRRKHVFRLGEARSICFRLRDLVGIAFIHVELHALSGEFSANERLGAPYLVILVHRFNAQNGIGKTRLKRKFELRIIDHHRIWSESLRKIAREHQIRALRALQADYFVAFEIGNRNRTLEDSVNIDVKHGLRHFTTRNCDHQIVGPVVRRRSGKDKVHARYIHSAASTEHLKLCVRSSRKADAPLEHRFLACEMIALVCDTHTHAVDVTTTLPVIHVHRIRLVDDCDCAQLAGAFYRSGNLAHSRRIGLARRDGARNALRKFAQRKLGPFVLDTPRRMQSNRPQTVRIDHSLTVCPNRKLWNENMIVNKCGNILVKPCRHQFAALQLLRCEGLYRLSFKILPCEGHRNILAIESSVRNIENFHFKRFSGHQFLAVGHDKIRNRQIVAGNGVELLAVRQVMEISHQTLMRETVRNHWTETRIFVLFVPFATNHEVRIEFHDRREHIAKHASAGGVEPVVPTVGILMTRSRPATETLLLEFRRRKDRMHKRHENRIEKPRIVPAIETGFTPVIAKSVEYAKRAL